MKILMLVNWKVEYCTGAPPEDKQPPDYYVKGQPYWFYRYFKESVEVDVIDVHSFPWWEHIEKEKIRFYIVQTLRALPRIREYDLIVSHGMQSGVVLSLVRRLFPTKAKHIVFEIGSFNSASESGFALKLMQFASKSIDGFIYHTSRQKEYYRQFFPWIVEKSRFIPFGTDAGFFCVSDNKIQSEQTLIEQTLVELRHIICVGYSKRDWDTLYKAFEQVCGDRDTDKEIRESLRLKLIGNPDFQCNSSRVEVMPYIPIKQLMQEIQGAYCCVVPLKEFNYSFGQMTLLQQMSLGKAVIASKVSSLTDYTEDGKTALLYEAEDSESLGNKIKELLCNPRKKEELEKNAAEAVREYYNEKRMAEEVEEYLTGLWRKHGE